MQPPNVVHPDGHVDPPNLYAPVWDHENHEVDPCTLNRKEVPRHDIYALENSGEPAPDFIANTSFTVDPIPTTGPEPDGETESAPEAPATEDAEAEGVLTPPQSAVKADWVDYVVANYEVTTAEAEALTKAELIDLYGG